MPNPWADEMESGHRTRECVGDDHAECPHMMYPLGGGLNPRRLRLEIGAGLCTCDCHASCPVTSDRLTVKFGVWQELCTCPGADAERVRQEQDGTQPPDFAELWATSRQQRQVRRAAFDATKANAAGKTRDELKEMYVGELRSRDLTIPPPEVLDAIVDALTGNYVTGYATSARLLGQAVSGIAKLFDEFRHPG